MSKQERQEDRAYETTQNFPYNGSDMTVHEEPGEHFKPDDGETVFPWGVPGRRGREKGGSKVFAGPGLRLTLYPPRRRSSRPAPLAANYWASRTHVQANYVVTNRYTSLAYAGRTGRHAQTTHARAVLPDNLSHSPEHRPVPLTFTTSASRLIPIVPRILRLSKPCCPFDSACGG